MVNLLLVAIVIGVSFLGTGAVRAYALQKCLMDVPNQRSSHASPTPRGGGLSIVITFLSAIGFLFVIEEISRPTFMALFWGGGLISAIGFLDDHHHIAARWRIMIHFIAAAWALYWLGGLPAVPLSKLYWVVGWSGNLIALMALVWNLNLFNFMDGIDGIAAIEAISVAGGAAAIIFLQQGANIEFVLLLFLAASCAGFLVWNWPPAKIFMGDVGSGFLGYILGVFALLTAASGTLSVWVWVILLSVFLVDATVTLLRRLLRGERVYEAHCSHAYQRTARLYSSHKKVTFTVLGINIFWLFPLAWTAAMRPNTGLFLTMVAVFPLVILTLKFGAGKEEPQK